MVIIHKKPRKLDSISLDEHADYLRDRDCFCFIVLVKIGEFIIQLF